MTRPAKIIIIASVSLVAAGTFYIFYWRTKDAVTPSGVQTLQQFRVVPAGSVPVAAAAPAGTAQTLATSLTSLFGVPILPIETV